MTIKDREAFKKLQEAIDEKTKELNRLEAKYVEKRTGAHKLAKEVNSKREEMLDLKEARDKLTARPSPPKSSSAP